jgi:Fe-S-cluster containining protein
LVRNEMLSRMAIVHLAEKLTAQRDAFIARFLATPIIATAACHTCSGIGCCKQICICTLLESVTAYLFIDKSLMPAICARGSDMVYMATQHGLDPQCMHSYTAISDPWFDTNTLCALNVDGQCAIYPVRPASCSTYFVVKESAALCEPPSGRRVCSMDNMAPLLETVRLDFIFHEKLGLPFTEPIPLPLQLQAAAALLKSAT